MAFDGFNPDVYEMGEHSAGSPATYYPVLPGKWRMKWLVRRNMRATRRGPVVVTLELVRPLNEETGYMSVAEMSEQDCAHVLAGLQHYFEPKGLKVSSLKLAHLRKVTPRREFEEPYDLIQSTFTVGE